MTRAKPPKCPTRAKPKIGRPPTYQALFARQAERLVQDGATDAELASFFEVTTVTIWRWKTAHPEFCNALQRGKDLADDVVERSLFQRATGYSHPAVKIMQNEGEPVIVPYVQYYPPDTAAAFIWLKNRRPQRWRDRPVGDGEDDDIARARRIKAALSEIEDTVEQPAG
ncbi:helix-turn-helix domain-containing protein [Methylorubrum extorquens]|uniref:helix-turn-helix domain-containing protein n=1 Tax=Methylorubrum extorquens TaxID=408 RepID=UPI0022378EBA|nr:helix-turn-helix domain-containing protein [Methylorubrum extorquens]UYW34460.1 helix-turn-helix domain-containing protein [Methylorubrum extorquens]